MNLGVDPRHADQMVRGVVTLPNGTGNMSRRRFRPWPKADEARPPVRTSSVPRTCWKPSGSGKIEFDRCIATRT